MKLSENPEFREALNQAISDWEIKNFIVMSKASMLQVGSLEGSLRLRTDEAVTIKFISLESIRSDDDALAKIIDYAKSGRLGGSKDDGTILFHEEIVRHLNNNQTVIVKDKATGKAETRQITVEAISDVNYKLIQTILASLIAGLGLAKEEEEEKTKSLSDTVSRPHAPKGPMGSFSKSNAEVKQMEMKLNEITTGQDQRSKEAREKEKAEQKEQKRRAQEQKELRKENLKWDLKQENIAKERLNTDVQKHVRSKKPGF